ncbi:hypothetical protein [Pseudoalteromonas tunicata]|jgi:hypothetical protein|uniref:Putative orphan protein n=1 Tax=Pseudoalteromonas tunicata D2 TaxID=87626 RepID=A4CD83_9GAMM|nr:hypothetical protein [Pseudoalteromonas tunicata]ATC94032.1 hypothetical protein PTUN_a1396 [Pseudoalteromonas tunicata]AXT29815.1 hypothetical protein D1819_02565 [Pseudoalteromonas tunicata]EAR27526.1 putative orphan protein [Pseudoalteromonas tunicata D2]MDP4984014.1 hypothetical protein [Pseudoalteromonas tunicata]MDP5213765.1 hypothetical protein [Pseudoalteromonas tunicata]
MQSIPKEKKLSVLFRLEPGCLGPQGIDHVESFCTFVNSHLHQFYFAELSVIPRFDKSLPEWEYSINQRNLDDAKVGIYLTLFKTDKNSFEEQFEEQLTENIELFFSRTK